MKSKTIADAFELCGLLDRREYQALCYHPCPGASDYAWFMYDPNDGYPGISTLDGCKWERIGDCAGFTMDDFELLVAQIPSAMPINDLQISKANYDNLPGIVQDILEGRFRSVQDALSEDPE